jgi:hypothetical protein
VSDDSVELPLVLGRNVGNVERYWGYVLLVLLITAWWSRLVPAAALFVLSLAEAYYFLFRVPPLVRGCYP